MVTNQRVYNIVKARVKARVSRWPSAYASGMLVREYKAEMKRRGLVAYKNGTRPLRRWFREKWVDIKTGLPCGAVKTKGYYPTCRPSKKISSRTPKTVYELSASQKKMAIIRKQKAKKNLIYF
jgi:Ni,Fe-hydrogenase I small subunit